MPSGPVAETFRVIQGAVTEEYVRSTQGIFQFELSGDGGGTWYIDLKTKGGSAGFGKPPVTADVVMSMSSADFVKMFTEKEILPKTQHRRLCCQPATGGQLHERLEIAPGFLW
nr:hydroxysteroid dehydrogenase-like protein 2 [Lonchura striata domestica]